MSNITLNGFNCVLSLTDNPGFIPNSLRPGMLGMGNSPFYFALNNEEAYHRAYRECAPLKAIVSKRAKAFNNGTIELVKTTSSGNYAKDAWSTELLEKLERPNVLQSGNQFWAQQNIYTDIHGYCPVLIVRPTGMDDTISSVWNIPPWLFDLDWTGKWLKQTDRDGIMSNFRIKWNGTDEPLESKNLFFIFDDGIGTDADSNLVIPDSRLLSLEYPVSNIIGAYKSRNTLIMKRGAIGILSNESSDSVGNIPLAPGEKEGLQNDFKRYGLVGQEWQIIISEANLKWQQMGYPTKDLMLFEEIEADIKELCRGYSYPPELMGLTEAKYENKKYSKKELYSDSIIPEGNSRIEQFSKGVIPADKKVKLQRDYTGLDVFQEDEKTKAEVDQAINLACKTQYEAGLITKNDWLVALGKDTIVDDEFNKYKKDEPIVTPQN